MTNLLTDKEFQGKIVEIVQNNLINESSEVKKVFYRILLKTFKKGIPLVELYNQFNFIFTLIDIDDLELFDKVFSRNLNSSFNIMSELNLKEFEAFKYLNNTYSKAKSEIIFIILVKKLYEENEHLLYQEKKFIR